MTSLLATSLFTVIAVFCRVGACLMLVPGYSSVRVPMQFRLLIALILSVVLTPLVLFALPPISTDKPELFVKIIFAETLTGLFLGLMIRLLFVALEFIASAAAMSMGYGIMMGTPITEAEPQAAFGAFLSMAAIVLFFILGIHHSVLIGIARSYDVFTPGVFLEPGILLSGLASRLNDSFIVALRLGSPFLAYGLLINLIIGLLNKLTPQIPIYFISLPFVLFGGLVMAYFVFPSMLNQFIFAVEDMMLYR